MKQQLKKNWWWIHAIIVVIAMAALLAFIIEMMKADNRCREAGGVAVFGKCAAPFDAGTGTDAGK